MDELSVWKRDEFDEDAYLEAYPDVAEALQGNRVESGWWHYDNYGRAEGRKGVFFDQDFYLRSYPFAELEIRDGLAATPHEHFLMFGKGRGFLPFAEAKRPGNAAMSAPFGGLWPDAPNAVDILQGKLEIGQITHRQAALLSRWISDGYVILEQAVPIDLIDAAARDLDKAFSGGFDKLLFECHQVQPNATRWDPAIVPHPAKALDLHHFSPAVRDVLFAEAITRFFGLIFESKTFAAQSLGFLRGSAQKGHQDSAYVPFTIPRQFAATWVALEDVTVGAGELFYYVGSHRFPDFCYGGEFKSIAEAKRRNHTIDRTEAEEHVNSLRERAEARKMAKAVFAAKKGDVLVWHADLVHGGNPVSTSITRRSLVTHYCPKRLSPLFSESRATEIYDHCGHLFTSSYYDSADLVPSYRFRT